MAYTKQSWSCGDTITDEKMNHMENGIANAVEYDLIIDIGSASIVKGDYASIVAKLRDGGVVTGVAYTSSPYGDDYIYNHYVMSFAHHSSNNDVVNLQFYKVNQGSLSNLVEVYTYVVEWHNDDTLSNDVQRTIGLSGTV